MRHGSLFSGIGGFDLAAEWMGWENVFHCEWNEFGQKILKHYWPNAISYGDITKTDFTEWKGKVDIISGGFPCQPYSQAGKRKGKADDRHLWPQMLRAIREVQPRWVVGENVPGLLNWQRGMVLDEIKADLEASGFEVFPPLILPACGKNAPHRRDRLWIVAHSRSSGTRPSTRGINESRQLFQEAKWEENKQFDKSFSESWAIADPLFINGKKVQAEKGYAIIGQEFICNSQARGNRGWNSWPTEYPVCNGDDGIPRELDGITFSKWRNESIKGGGNAVVPQVAFEIFKAIEQCS